jgi:hypothetical protein
MEASSEEVEATKALGVKVKALGEAKKARRSQAYKYSH